MSRCSFISASRRAISGDVAAGAGAARGGATTNWSGKASGKAAIAEATQIFDGMLHPPFICVFLSGFGSIGQHQRRNKYVVSNAWHATIFPVAEILRLHGHVLVRDHANTTRRAPGFGDVDA